MREIIKELGFDEKESEIYLKLISIGKGTATDLMKKTKIERRTIYDILERLQQKGLVGSYKQNKITIFSPTEPKILYEMLKEKLENFKEIIPNLTQKQQTETKVELLKGDVALTTIFSDIISQNETHYAFGNIEPFIGKYKKIVDRWLKKLEQKNLKEKILHTKKQKLTKIKNGEYRVIDEQFIFPTPIIIYGNTVVQYVFDDPLTIIKITSKKISETYMQQFLHYWNNAK